MQRPYAQLIPQLRALTGTRAARMQAAVDILWAGLRSTGVSWLGFYLHTPENELELGPRRDKPACSPIGLHGVCGQALLQCRPRVVTDVLELGGNYVACDPRDRAELVLPLLDADGRCWGVLDLDSHAVGAFTDEDAAALQEAMLAAGLTSTIAQPA
jgi:putative methionine-R-sulfoxide reductase with GAF domain